MKYVSVIALVLLSGCVTHHSRKIVVVVRDGSVSGSFRDDTRNALRDVSALSSSEISSLRSGEVIKKYYVGAYVDPVHPNVRHDPHIVERIEQSSHWNLRPNVAVVASGPTYKAVAENALKNAMQQQYDHEMQEQRSINSQSLAQVSELKKEIAALKDSLHEESENGLRKVEEKIESLAEKVTSSPKNKVDVASPPIQQSPTTTPQGNRPWELPIE